MGIKQIEVFLTERRTERHVVREAARDAQVRAGCVKVALTVHEEDGLAGKFTKMPVGLRALDE